MPHPPYSPDLAPSDFFLKNVLKRKRFANVEEVKQKMVEALKGVKIDELKNCLEKWKKMSRSLSPFVSNFSQMENTSKMTEV